MARIRYRRALLYLGLFLAASLALVNLVAWLERSPTTAATSESILSNLEPDNYERVDWSGDMFPQDYAHNFTNEPDYLSHYRLEWSISTTRQVPLSKPWFLSNGTIRPSPRYASKLALWPEEVAKNSVDPNTDRIINQLMYVPQGKPMELVCFSNT